MSGPTITHTRGTFWFACRVEIEIQAPSQSVWEILTDAEGYPRWRGAS